MRGGREGRNLIGVRPTKYKDQLNIKICQVSSLAHPPHLRLPSPPSHQARVAEDQPIDHAQVQAAPLACSGTPPGGSTGSTVGSTGGESSSAPAVIREEVGRGLGVEGAVEEGGGAHYEGGQGGGDMLGSP